MWSYFYDIVYEANDEGIKVAKCRRCECGCMKFKKDINNHTVCLSCGKEVENEMHDM